MILGFSCDTKTLRDNQKNHQSEKQLFYRTFCKRLSKWEFRTKSKREHDRNNK